MQIDAVVIGTIASVVVTIIIGAIIGYNVIRKIGNDSDDK